MSSPSDIVRATTAAAIVIGSEILSGKVRDENVQALALTLRSLGVELRSVVVIPDEVDTIAAAVRDAAARYDFVVTSGGLGPTHDDVTVQAVARAFDVDVVVEPRLVELIEAHVGGACTDEHLRMARVPATARVLDPEGSRWPVVAVRNTWLLPGVPEVFRAKLQVVRALVRGPSPLHGASVTLHRDEPSLVLALDRVAAAFPDVFVGSYPQWDAGPVTLVTFDGRDEAAVARARAEFLAAAGVDG